jgi:broad specificity phosphatase PhoE
VAGRAVKKRVPRDWNARLDADAQDEPPIRRQRRVRGAQDTGCPDKEKTRLLRFVADVQRALDRLRREVSR